MKFDITPPKTVSSPPEPLLRAWLAIEPWVGNRLVLRVADDKGDSDCVLFQITPKGAVIVNTKVLDRFGLHLEDQ